MTAGRHPDRLKGRGIRRESRGDVAGKQRIPEEGRFKAAVFVVDEGVDGSKNPNALRRYRPGWRPRFPVLNLAIRFVPLALGFPGRDLAFKWGVCPTPLRLECNGEKPDTVGYPLKREATGYKPENRGNRVHRFPPGFQDFGW